MALFHRREQPPSRWRKAYRLHALIRRESNGVRDLYRRRAGVELEFGRLKTECGLTRSASAAVIGWGWTPTADPRQAHPRPERARRSRRGLARHGAAQPARAASAPLDARRAACV